MKHATGTESPAHSKIHTNAYKQNIYDRLIYIEDAEEFVLELENISNLISAGKFSF